jgi:hypothetical protein
MTSTAGLDPADGVVVADAIGRTEGEVGAAAVDDRWILGGKPVAEQ